MFISAFEKAFGKEYDLSRNTGFLKTAGFLENMIGPTGLCFNYSDGGAGGGFHQAMFWLANRTKDPWSKMGDGFRFAGLQLSRIKGSKPVGDGTKFSTMVGFETTVPANTKTVLQVLLLPGGVSQNPATIPGALSKWPK
jgi:hypothetical protein